MENVNLLDSISNALSSVASSRLVAAGSWMGGGGKDAALFFAHPASILPSSGNSTLIFHHR